MAKLVIIMLKNVIEFFKVMNLQKLFVTLLLVQTMDIWTCLLHVLLLEDVKTKFTKNMLIHLWKNLYNIHQKILKS